MRKLLNTLYVTTPEAYLSKDGLNVVISVQQEEVFRIPVINTSNPQLSSSASFLRLNVLSSLN